VDMEAPNLPGPAESAKKTGATIAAIGITNRKNQDYVLVFIILSDT